MYSWLTSLNSNNSRWSRSCYFPIFYLRQLRYREPPSTKSWLPYHYATQCLLRLPFLLVNNYNNLYLFLAHKNYLDNVYSIFEAQKFRNLLALNFMLIETYFKDYQWGVIKRKFNWKVWSCDWSPRAFVIRLFFQKHLGLGFVLIKGTSILGAIPWPLHMAWRETSIILAFLS